MSRKQVVDIDFYLVETLPYPMAKEAEKQGIKIGRGLIAVKTIINSPIRYEFTNIKQGPDGLRQFYFDMAAEDGIDLNEVAKNIMK